MEREQTAEQVGARVVIAKERATVRYLGSVAGQKGVWAGVEWDDPTRGKHDGTTGGVKYFQCASGLPTAGSFVRIEKVHFGSSVVDAIRARYAEQEASSDAYVHTASNRKVLVQLVGEEQVRQRQRQTELLTRARLVGEGVSSAGKADDLAALVPNLGELDLTDNLLSSWQPVAAMLQALPQLHTVVLTQNRLALNPEGAYGYPMLTNLRSLVLNSCGVSWQQIASLQASLPNLTELHACGNSISSLSVAGDAGSEGTHSSSLVTGFAGLQILDLEDNGIDWQQALRLSALPSLTRLQLSHNPITEVTYPAATQPLPSASPAASAAGSAPNGTASSAAYTTPPAACTSAASATPSTAAETVGPGMVASARPAFAKLSTLLLGHCQISSWRCVDQLARFPALADLRLSDNPLVADAKSGGRFEVIGRVGSLTMLNGADIGPRERRDSDLRYLQNAVADLEEAAAAAGAAGAAEARAAASQAHPRLQALVDKYGYVSAASNKALYQGSTLSSTMCELVLKHGARSSKKKLPRTTTVAALKLLCERLFKVKADRQALLLADPDTGAVEDIAQDDTKELAFYNIQPGTTLEVCDDDPEARRLAAAAQQEKQRLELQARMAVQLREGDYLRKAAEQ